MTEKIFIIHRSRRLELKERCIIGRDPSADLHIDSPDISRKHAVIFIEDGGIFLQDLNSRNGTFMNGMRIEGRVQLYPDCSFRVADEEIRVVREKISEDATSPREIVERVRKKLIKTIDVFSTGREKVEKAVEEILREEFGEEGERFLPVVLRDVVGYGPIEDFIKDESITEIMVNGPNQIYIEKNGKLILTDAKFSSDEDVMRVIERIVAPLGRRIDESQPYVDARLPDGSRVNAIIPPLALQGPTITIRKFSKKKYTVDDLIKFGSLSREMAYFLKLAVENRKNIVVSGGTGSGKTTLLNVIASFIPSGERIITIEDAAELRLPQEHIVSLEARPPNIEGKGAVTIRDLVRNSLRMRPDRIVVGECRGGEALDMLQAMNTGHSGSMTTLHANSPRDAISRLATMTLMAGIDLPLRAVNEWIASAVDIIVQVERFRDGSRKVTHIVEVKGMEGDAVVLLDIFKFEIKSIREGKIYGEFVPTGFIPDFIHHLRERGIDVDLSIFGGA